ncbi:MAG TPA: flagellar basal body P-ring formation chaperone FlgA [Tepidisphaeraceae bacterium]
MFDNRNGNGRPVLTRKQTVRLMIALTILAWATQTLLKQWGFGAEIVPATAEAATEPAAQQQEKFVPGTSRYAMGATLEMRAEATVVGAEVKLRQICRWSDRDKFIFDPIGDLILARLSSGAPFKSVSVQEIKATLRDAGINVAAINFAGPTSCTISRTDVEYDEQNGLRQWVEAKQGTQQIAGNSTTAPSTAPMGDQSPILTLRDALVVDLAHRLNLPPESLQVDFKSQDEKILNISKPLFKFDIDPVRAKSLGNVMWNVTITTDSGTKKVSVSALARAWQDQAVVTKPLATRQVIRSEDVLSRRTLVDQISDDPLVTSDQVLGQQASRELKPGTVLTGRMLDPVQLVKVGQYVTVTLEQGTVRIKTVAKALEGGSFGQTIRVKNEATKDVFQVVLTGPQTATMNLATPVAAATAQN